MILGRVVGNVWASEKDPRLERCKLLIVRPYGSYELGPAAEQVVCVDTLGAGVGEDVVVCLGWPARDHLGGHNLPVEAAVMAIVDRCQLSREAAAERQLGFRGGAPTTLEIVEDSEDGDEETTR